MTCKQNSKPQTNYRYCYLQFSFLPPYWLFRWKTTVFYKYFWCSNFESFTVKACKSHCYVRLGALCEVLPGGVPMSPIWILKRLVSVFINACRLLSALPSLSQFGQGRLSLVAISFYALSLLFGPCHLSEFTLAGPPVWILYLVFCQTSDSPQCKCK